LPATQRGQAYRLDRGKWGIRYYDLAGKRCRKSPFSSKSAALQYYRDVIEPELRGEPARAPELTLAELVDLYLERHAAAVRVRTIVTLRERLRYAVTEFGEVRVRDLERMSGDIAGWRARLPERSAHGIAQALRQTLAAGVRWGYLGSNPATAAGPNRQPPPRTVRVYSPAELETIAAELHPAYRSIPGFAAATGLRPEEWQALEWRDVDRAGGVVTVLRTISNGQVVEIGKTDRSRRQVPLTERARSALDAIPRRLDTPLVFPAAQGGPINLDNWRRREWAPAIEAGAIAKPARIYDLRSTFASYALAAGVSIFELPRIMGTSIRMIEAHYGALLEGSGAAIAAKLDAYEGRLGH
jgi:integrase